MAVSISRRDCARLTRHVPAGDVAYQPGVDVKGRRVVPADLEGSGAGVVAVPELLEFTTPVNPLKYYGGRRGKGGWGEGTELPVANIAYDTNTGRFLINGQPLGSPEQQRIAEACAKRAGERTK